MVCLDDIGGMAVGGYIIGYTKNGLGTFRPFGTRILPIAIRNPDPTREDDLARDAIEPW